MSTSRSAVDTVLLPKCHRILVLSACMKHDNIASLETHALKAHHVTFINKANHSKVLLMNFKDTLLKDTPTQKIKAVRQISYVEYTNASPSSSAAGQNMSTMTHKYTQSTFLTRLLPLGVFVPFCLLPPRGKLTKLGQTFDFYFI